MIRILIFLLSLALFAWAITALMSLDGWIEGRVFDVRYEVHAGFAAVCLLSALVLTAAVTSFVKDLRRVPKAFGQKRAESQQETALSALSRGYEAIAAGDAAAARKNARIAARAVNDESEVRLLLAQSAQLAGDDASAKEQFEAMAADPKTEIPALRGLYLHARKAGDAAEAERFARRAFDLNPGARWAYEALFALALDRGNWSDAREFLRRGAKERHVEPEAARRAEAALLGAQAYAAEAGGDRSGALDAAEQSLKLQPAFAPSAALAAKIFSGQGKTARAEKIIERAFAADPHPALIDALLEAHADEPPANRAEALERLHKRSATSSEDRYLEARRRLVLGEARPAMEAIKPSLVDSPSARHFLVMADASAMVSGPEAARLWLERAAAAGARTGDAGFETLTADGWRLLVRHYTEQGRLFPPPVERPQLVVTEADLMLPPPQAPLPEPAVETPAAERTEAVIGAAGQVS